MAAGCWVWSGGTAKENDIVDKGISKIGTD